MSKEEQTRAVQALKEQIAIDSARTWLARRYGRPLPPNTFLQAGRP